MADNKINLFFIFSLIAFFSFAPIIVHAQIMVGPCDLFPNSPECTGDRDPVIVVPGIVGSFNMLSLFADIPSASWGPVPFYKIYQGLVSRLEAEGYVKNQDLFVAYYDWRKLNTDSAREFLAPIIAQAKQKTGRVDIVAHSMGGLLVQQYIASDQYTPGEIDQFVMLGTPNESASAAYLPWEGGIFPSTWSVPVRFYIKGIHDALKKERNIEDVAPKSFRQIFPSLKELLPVGNYIKKGDTESSSIERNTFLEGLISVRDNLLNSDIGITTIAGSSNNTLDTVAVSDERSPADQLLDCWRDGHSVQEVPVPNNPDGDTAVLKISALFGPNQVTIENVVHDALPEHAQNEALQALGIISDKPNIFTYQEPKWLTGFVVLSPVDITITDENGKTVSKDTNDFGNDAFVDITSDGGTDDPKIIILQNLPEGKYTVHLTGTGAGPYTVITTHTNESTSESQILAGTTTLGKQESFTVTISDDGAEVSKIKRDGPDDDDDDHDGHHPKKIGHGKILNAIIHKLKNLSDRH